MALIRISQIPPYDGEYELDIERAFTTRELRWIKQMSGYLPRTLQEGLEGGDADLFIALAVIAMERAGKVPREDVLQVADRLSDIPLDDENGKIQILAEEDDQSPPASTPEPEPSSPRSLPASSESSSIASSDGSEPSGESPATTGATRSPTSLTSVRTQSGT